MTSTNICIDNYALVVVLMKWWRFCTYTLNRIRHRLFRSAPTCRLSGRGRCRRDHRCATSCRELRGQRKRARAGRETAQCSATPSFPPGRVTWLPTLASGSSSNSSSSSCRSSFAVRRRSRSGESLQSSHNKHTIVPTVLFNACLLKMDVSFLRYRYAELFRVAEFNIPYVWCRQQPFKTFV